MVARDDKRRARIDVLTHVLKSIPWKPTESEKVKLPKRQKPGGYVAPKYPYKYIDAGA